MGCIYRQKGTKNYTIKYYRNGRPIVESTRSNKREVAERLLKLREGEIAKGEPPGIYFDRVLFDELAEDFLTDYRICGKKSLDKVERCVRNLTKVFGGMRVTDITTARIRAYIEAQMKQGYANGSINRELAALKRMLRLGAQCTPPKVSRVPHIPMLKELNIRKGFFEHEEYLALREAVPEYFKPVVAFAYVTGWRKNEILGLTWDRVDLKYGVVRLDPGETKNNEGRTLFLDGELLKAMQVLHKDRRLGFPYVFHRYGRPIQDITDVWEKACKEAGLWAKNDKKERMTPTKIFHDFRRTAVRNMIRAGIPERVAMMISGHKTRSVFDRYNIVSEQDLREAARKQQAYLEQLTVSERKDCPRGRLIPLVQAQGFE